MRRIMVAATGAVPTTIAVVPGRGDEIRPRGWSPDGRRVVYATTNGSSGWFQTHILDLASGDLVRIDAGAGRLSNDGTRVAACRLVGKSFYLCVANSAGGPCVAIGGPIAEPNPTHGDALNWSPDDEWVIVYPKAGGKVFLVDPDGIKPDIEIAADGAGSWQRVAR